MNSRFLKILLYFLIIILSIDILLVVDIASFTNNGVKQSNESLSIIKEKSNIDYSKRVREYFLGSNYTSGSELASAAILLRAYGYGEATTETFINLHYIDFNDTNWTTAYYGNALEDGWCYSRALQSAINKFIADRDKRFTAYTNFENINDLNADYISKGIPAIVWFTSDYQNPRWIKNDYNKNNEYSAYRNHRTVVLYKIDKEYVYIVDPINGKQKIDYNRFEQVFESCGCQSIVLK